MWFDDLTVTHSQSLVVQSTDYGVWGDVLREQKSDSKKYRFGYQGQFAEKDDETGWSHFELRELDPTMGRWTSVDPAGQFFSAYLAMSNNPVSATDPDGGWVWGAGLWNNLIKSDERIHSERIAGSVISQAAGQFAMKSDDGRWGVGWHGNVKDDTGLNINIERYFTPVGDDGEIGAVEMEVVGIYTGPSPGTIDFDAATQYMTGEIFVAGAQTAYAMAASVARREPTSTG